MVQLALASGGSSHINVSNAKLGEYYLYSVLVMESRSGAPEHARRRTR